MLNQPNYLGGFLVIVVFVVCIFLKRVVLGQPIDPSDFPPAIVQDYRSFGQTLEDGYEADRKAFLAFKALVAKGGETQLEHPLADLPEGAYFEMRSTGYDPAQDAREQGVGE